MIHFSLPIMFSRVINHQANLAILFNLTHQRNKTVFLNKSKEN